MTLNILPKKPFTDYTEAEQQEILSRGQAILARKLEQGESISQEDTWCKAAWLQSQRQLRFKPTVEKIVKEKPLTKAQKLELLNESIGLAEADLSDKHKLVLEELVGVDKEYYIFILQDGVKELVKLTKPFIKQKLKDLSDIELKGGYFRGTGKKAVFYERHAVTTSEREFLTAMTGAAL